MKRENTSSSDKPVISNMVVLAFLAFIVCLWSGITTGNGVLKFLVLLFFTVWFIPTVLSIPENRRWGRIARNFFTPLIVLLLGIVYLVWISENLWGGE